eukprot:CAMPEP_0184672572 /NCGR_PEP_ID=MMETSP0308-20130426/86172_1 /TAXON_ID=38269 /ORGANISM="Gloeochaete witrockiana, Strain SAG 46.84" /LENGTH=313 /DNA_ID=CAMNT_0027119915 /DNA_START=1871 /DNA_END=2812 /DNA_ORIENTATION=-
MREMEKSFTRRLCDAEAAIQFRLKECEATAKKKHAEETQGLHSTIAQLTSELASVREASTLQKVSLEKQLNDLVQMLRTTNAQVRTMRRTEKSRSEQLAEAECSLQAVSMTVESHNAALTVLNVEYFSLLTQWLDEDFFFPALPVSQRPLQTNEIRKLEQDLVSLQEQVDPVFEEGRKLRETLRQWIQQFKSAHPTNPSIQDFKKFQPLISRCTAVEKERRKLILRIAAVRDRLAAHALLCSDTANLNGFMGPASDQREIDSSARLKELQDICFTDTNAANFRLPEKVHASPWLIQKYHYIKFPDDALKGSIK